MENRRGNTKQGQKFRLPTRENERKKITKGLLWHLPTNKEHPSLEWATKYLNTITEKYPHWGLSSWNLSIPWIKKVLKPSRQVTYRGTETETVLCTMWKSSLVYTLKGQECRRENVLTIQKVYPTSNSLVSLKR